MVTENCLSPTVSKCEGDLADNCYDDSYFSPIFSELIFWVCSYFKFWIWGNMKFLVFWHG